MAKLDSQTDGTRELILSTSAELFREYGYAGVSMRKIAETCNMKAGSLYYHFTSKDQILIEVLNIGIQKVHSAVSVAVSDLRKTASGAERLRQAIYGHLAALLEFSAFTSANVRIFGQVPETVRQSNLDDRRAYEELWDAFLSELKIEGHLREDVDVRMCRLMLIGALNATLEWFDPDQGDIEKLADRYSEMLAGGIIAEHGK